MCWVVHPSVLHVSRPSADRTDRNSVRVKLAQERRHSGRNLAHETGRKQLELVAEALTLLLINYGKRLVAT